MIILTRDRGRAPKKEIRFNLIWLAMFNRKEPKRTNVKVVT